MTSEPHTFPCLFDGPHDYLTVSLQPDGTLLLVARSGHDEAAQQAAVYLNEGGMGELADTLTELQQEAKAINRKREAERIAAEAVKAIDPEPEVNTATAAEVPAVAPSSFAATTMPQPGTEARERAYIRARFMLGEDASVVKILALAKFLLTEEI
ncbi:hypothetical protein [Kitasatospora purpeofusca]|uniref:hypothetical protein n=1 Tax=Kitasatospora purpeofusca TaxID=67352 RepID=UPI003673BADB